MGMDAKNDSTQNKILYVNGGRLQFSYYQYQKFNFYLVKLENYINTFSAEQSSNLLNIRYEYTFDTNNLSCQTEQ